MEHSGIKEEKNYELIMHIENSMSLIYTVTRNKIQSQKFEKI